MLLVSLVLLVLALMFREFLIRWLFADVYRLFERVEALERLLLNLESLALLLLASVLKLLASVPL